MLATSDNLTAEMLVKEIGLVAGAAGHPRRRVCRPSPTGSPRGACHGRAWRSPTAPGSAATTSSRARRWPAVLQRGSATDAVGAGLARGRAGRLDARRRASSRTGLVGVLQGKTGTLCSEVKSLSGYFRSGDDEVDVRPHPQRRIGRGVPAGRGISSAAALLAAASRARRPTRWRPPRVRRLHRRDAASSIHGGLRRHRTLRLRRAATACAR